MPSIQSCNAHTANGSELAQLTPLLICPSCRQHDRKLLATAQTLQCPQCDASFPVYRNGRVNIPWLFSDPDGTRLQWKARLNGFLQVNEIEQHRLKTAIEDKGVGNTGRRRIENLIQARELERTQIPALLSPLALSNVDLDCNFDSANMLHAKLPKNQGLSSYHNNIFRDWAWNNGENEYLFDVISGILPTGCSTSETGHLLGKILTLGAGACRLSYDIHRKYSPALSVVLDINPLLLFLASRLIEGETIPLPEFPIAPLDSASFAVCQNCVAPGALDPVSRQRFQFVLADGMNPPFVPGCFDTVLTPWLIDIMPQNLSEFMPRVNRVLTQGGLWINTGSLAFFHASEAWRYSEEEVMELLEANGFECLTANRRTIPYLQSPRSAHGRTENVFSFCAKKVKDIPVEPLYECLPEWILDTAQAVPGNSAVAVASSTHLLQAQVLAAIDGTRTIDEIGALVAGQYGLPVGEAINAVRRILTDRYEGDRLSVGW